METRSFLSLEDIDREEIREILDLARVFAEGRLTGVLESKTVCLAFFEASTRTAVSFELAARRSGAHVISLSEKGSAIGHPVYADPLYGSPVPGHRLWLHAERLSFEHPVGGEALEFHSDIPEDLRDSAAGLDGSLALW